MARSSDGLITRSGVASAVHFEDGREVKAGVELGTWAVGHTAPVTEAATFSWTTHLVASLVQGTASVVCGGGFELNSDHRPMDAKLWLERKGLWSEVRQDDYTQRGWAPKSEEGEGALDERCGQGLVLDADRDKR